MKVLRDASKTTSLFLLAIIPLDGYFEIAEVIFDTHLSVRLIID
jgi:hypothetical protein